MSFDSFARSDFGGFTQSPLLERNATLPTFPIDVTWDLITRSGKLLLHNISAALVSELVTGYACHNLGGSTPHPTPLDLTKRTGKVVNYRAFPAQEMVNAAINTRACPGNSILTTTQEGEWLTAKAIYDTDFGGQFGGGAKVSNDVEDARRMTVRLTCYDPATDLVVGLGACSAGGWEDSEPPDGIFNGPVGAGAPSGCYMVFSRSVNSASWSALAGPYLVPVVSSNTYDFLLPNETTDRLWAIYQSGALAEVYDLEADHASATINSITFPAAQGSVVGAKQWGKFVAIERSSGNVNVYHDETLLGSLGSPHVPGTSFQWAMGWGWLVTVQSDELHIWELDDATPALTFDSTLSPSGTWTTPFLCGESAGVIVNPGLDNVTRFHRTGHVVNRIGSRRG